MDGHEELGALLQIETTLWRNNMLKKVMFAIAMLAMASYAGAMSLNADGLTIQGQGDVNWVQDRLGLVNDGSFEFGECDAGSAWTCTTTTTCAWILDPTAVWGYPAYDGLLVAWLGGFCGDANSNSFCQDLFIDGMTLDWYWMGYVNNGCGTIIVSVDGTPLLTYVLQLSDHTYGTWGLASDSAFGAVDMSAYCGMTVNVCFEELYCDIGTNDNMLIDYVVLNDECSTATDDASISTVKALY